MSVRNFVAGVCVGAGIMYLADPKMGKRRISLIRDQFVKAGNRTGRFISGRSEDLKNRISGVYCEAKSLFGSGCEPKTARRRTA